MFKSPNRKKGFRGAFEIPIEIRFWEKVDTKENEDCWQWLGYIGMRGYGYIRHRGAATQAHRVSYELNVAEIPKRMVVDHLCNNPSCVNPNHLQICTQSENVKRGKQLKISLQKVTPKK